MNELSWMIYFAGVLGDLGVVLTLIAIVTLAIFAIMTVVGAVMMADNESYGLEDKDYLKAQKLFRYGVRRLWIPPLLVVLTCLIPSEDTVYAIAATEIGEQVLDSDTGGKAVKALNAWLDRQITDESGK